MQVQQDLVAACRGLSYFGAYGWLPHSGAPQSARNHHCSGEETERVKYAAFFVSSLIGYVIGHFLLDGAAAAYASVLISYHLYLVLLVIFALQEKGFAMPIGMTLVMHTAFVAFLVGFAYARTHIPFFGLLSLLIPAVAPFEANWL